MPSPSEHVHAVGLRSLRQVAQITGASEQTLINWHRTKPQLFATVLRGAKYYADYVHTDRAGTRWRVAAGSDSGLVAGCVASARSKGQDRERFEVRDSTGGITAFCEVVREGAA